MSPLWNLIHDLNASGVLSTTFFGLVIVLFAGAVHTRGRS